MTTRRPRPAYVDDRGSITDILSSPIDHVTVITSRADALRGNHYHKETTQYLYMLRGRMRLTTQRPGGPVQSVVLSEGDVIENPPGERHAMRALEESAFMVFSRGPRAGADFESDTYRLPVDELLEPQ